MRFLVVVIVVPLIAFAVAIVALATSGGSYDRIGRGGLSLDDPPPAAPPAEREADLRDLLEARNARRVARGEPPADVDAELRALRAAGRSGAGGRGAPARRGPQRPPGRARRAAARRRGGGEPEAPRVVDCGSMPRLRRLDLEELSTRPGTYFNPETEILIVVDDSNHPGAELADDADDGDWILVGDEVPVDEAQRDELLERLEVTAVRAGETDAEDDEVVEDEDELEPDPDPDEY